MRILIATSHRNVVGGVENYLRVAIPGLLDRAHEVGLLYEFPFDANRETIDPAKAPVPSWCAGQRGCSGVLESLAAWKPDIVYSNGIEAGELENALLERYPVVFYAHNYYGTCVSAQKCHAWPEARPCGREFGSGCLALYYPRRCGGLNPVTMVKQFRRQSECNARLPRFERILVASRHMQREFLKHGVNPDRLHLVPLPNTGVPDPNPPSTRVPGGNLLFAGRLTELKGASLLIQALPAAARKLARPLRLVIAGDGPERNRLEGLARRLGVDVDFAGWVDHDERVKLMRAADLLVVPSVWPEPFGLVGIEAGCLGLPSVAFAVGGIPDWLIPGESGESAPGDTPCADSLAPAIDRALADVEHYQNLRRGAWETARQFTLADHLAKLEPLLCSGDTRSVINPATLRAESTSAVQAPHATASAAV